MTGYVLGDHVGFVLRQVTQRHVGLFTALMPDPITPPQWAALITLHNGGAVAQAQLGRLAAMDGATVKGVVDRLVARGAVQTEPDASDGRQLLVSLTQSGSELVARSLGPAIAATEATLAPLTPAERRTLLDLLRRLT